MIIQMNQDNMNDYSSSNEHFIVFGTSLAPNLT